MLRPLFAITAALAILVSASGPATADRVYEGTSQFYIFIDWTPFVDTRDPTCLAGNDINTASGPACRAPAPLVSGVRVGGRNSLGIPIDRVVVHWGDGTSNTYTSHATGLQECFSGSQQGCDFSHYYGPRAGYYTVWVEVWAGSNVIETSDHPIGACFTSLVRCGT